MNFFFKYYVFLKLLCKLMALKYRYPYCRLLRVKKKIGTLFSQDGQDLYILPILLDQLKRDNNNWVIDVGANHPIKYSNTVLFEKYFGCKTIAIEPLREFESIWAEQRPKAEFICVAAGSSKGEIQINVPIQGDMMFASVNGGTNKNFHTGSYEVRTIQVDTITNILKNRGIRDVLLLSIDVEGFEIEVLKGIDFSTTSFQVIVCENNSDGLLGCNDVRDYLISRGFNYYARLGWNDDLFINKSFLKAQQKKL